MSLPTVLAIDPNRKIIKNIVESLRRLGFTVLEDPHYPAKAKYSGFGEIMGIIFPEDLAGLVLETFGNLPLSDKTVFYVICQEKNGHEFDYYGPEDKLFKIYSRTPMNEQMNVILRSIPFPDPEKLMGNYVTEAYLDISTVPLSKLMQYYHKQLFSGYFIIDWEQERTILQLQNGNISNIISTEPVIIDSFADLDGFKNGTIRIERYIPSKEQLIAQILESDSLDKKPADLNIDLEDIVTDAYYYLFLYLAQYFDKYQIQAQFKTALIEFNNSAEGEKINISISLEDETIFTFNPPITRDSVDIYIEFLRYFFFKMEQIYPEIKIGELFKYYEEIKPYLESIRFFEKFLRRHNNSSSKKGKLIPQ